MNALFGGLFYGALGDAQNTQNQQMLPQQMSNCYEQVSSIGYYRAPEPPEPPRRDCRCCGAPWKTRCDYCGSAG